MVGSLVEELAKPRKGQFNRILINMVSCLCSVLLKYLHKPPLGSSDPNQTRYPLCQGLMVTARGSKAKLFVIPRCRLQQPGSHGLGIRRHVEQGYCMLKSRTTLKQGSTLMHNTLLSYHMSMGGATRLSKVQVVPDY